jgi:hypothetical protein
MAWAARRCGGGRASLLIATLVGGGYWLVMYSRVPVTENLVVALLALASAFALGKEAPSRFAAGTTAGVAVLFGKLHAIAFLPALALFLVLRERRASAIALPAAGAAVSLILWLLLIYLPFRAEIAQHVCESSALYGSAPFLSSFVETVAEPLKTIRFSWLFYRMPVLGTLGGFFALWTIGSRDARQRRLESGSALFAFWFIFTWIYLTLLPYKAPRYFLLAGVPLAACAGFQLRETLRSPRGAAETLTVGLWVYLTAYTAIDSFRHYLAMSANLFRVPHSSVFRFLERTLDSVAYPLYQLWLVSSLALVLGVVLWLVLRRTSPEAWGVGRRVASLALGLALVVNLGQYAWWASHRIYAIEEAKASFDAIVADDAVLLGGFAPVLVQDSRKVAVPQFGDPDQGTIERHGVTHVVLGQPGDRAPFEAAYPGLLERMALIRQWPFRTRHVRALRLHRLPPEIASSVYEPSLFEAAVHAMDDGRYEEAIMRFHEFRRSAGEIPDAFSLEAKCHYLIGDPVTAKECLGHAIELRPTNPEDYFNLGTLVRREGDVDAARRLWLRGLRFDPFDETMAQAVTGSP